LAIGAAGVLWTLADQAIDQGPRIGADSVRDNISASLTLTLIGLLVWITHWQPEVAASERRALSRRLYTFGALLGSVLTLLGSSVFLIGQLLSILLGAASDQPLLAISHALAVGLVASAIALYHLRILRADSQLRDGGQDPSAGVESEEAIPKSSAPILVEVVGASEEQIREALAQLPSGAQYLVRRSS